MPVYVLANGMPIVEEDPLSPVRQQDLRTAQLIETCLARPGRLPVSPGFRLALDNGYGGQCVRRLRTVARTSPDAKKRQAAARILRDLKQHRR